MATVEQLTACDWPLPVVSVVDRRTASARQKRTRFVFVRSLEQIVWHAKDVSNGVFYQLMQRHSLESTIFRVDKACVEEDYLTAGDFNAILAAFKMACVPDVEKRGRVRQCSLVPVAAAVSALTAFGHTPETSGVLKALKSLPKSWKLVEQKEEHDRNNEVCLTPCRPAPSPMVNSPAFPPSSQIDPLIDDQIEEAQDENLEDYSFMHELVLEFVCWEASAEDDAKIPAIAVTDRSPLAKQLQELESFRCSKLNRFRAGSAVQRSTCEGEKGAVSDADLSIVSRTLFSHPRPLVSVAALPRLVFAHLPDRGAHPPAAREAGHRREGAGVPRVAPIERAGVELECVEHAAF
jgi:hypothetical protein